MPELLIFLALIALGYIFGQLAERRHYRSIIEQTIRLLIRDDIKLWRDGVFSKGEILEKVCKHFEEALCYAELSVDRVNRRDVRRPNRAPDKRVKEKIHRERDLLNIFLIVKY